MKGSTDDLSRIQRIKSKWRVKNDYQSWYILADLIEEFLPNTQENQQEAHFWRERARVMSLVHPAVLVCEAAIQQEGEEFLLRRERFGVHSIVDRTVLEWTVVVEASWLLSNIFLITTTQTTSECPLLDEKRTGFRGRRYLANRCSIYYCRHQQSTQPYQKENNQRMTRFVDELIRVELARPTYSPKIG